jgi:hypothetical protein
MTDTSVRKHPARASRIAAAGIGVAAMLGLASGLEIAGRAQTSGSTPATGAARTTPTPSRAARSSARRTVAVLSRRPIVLTPRAVVHVVRGAAPAASGGSAAYGHVASVSATSSSSGQASASVSAPAAAPVATTSGSH